MQPGQVRCPEVSDDRLLAWIEGQHNVFKAWRIKRHLYRCWSCRARAAQLDAAIRAIQEDLSQSALPRPDVEAARWRFWQAVHAGGEGASRETPGGRRSLSLPWLVGSVAAVSLAALIAFGDRHASVGENPLTTIRSLERLETAGFASAIRQQSYQIEISAPGHPTIKRNWDRWAAPRHNAFKSVWSDDTGRVREVLYNDRSRPEQRGNVLRYADGAEFHRLAGSEATSDQTLWNAVHLALFGSVTPEQAILNWAAKQLWRPVSLAYELAEFQGRTDAVLRMRRIGDAWEITAGQVIDGRRVSMRLVANADGTVPKLLQISWQKGADKEVVSVVRRGEILYSDFGLARGIFDPGPLADHKRLPPRQRAPKAPSVQSPVDDLRAARIEVFEVLHKLNLCMKHTVRVSEKNGYLDVSGFVADGEERQRLQEAIETLPLRYLIRSGVEWPGISNRPTTQPTPQNRTLSQEQSAPIERWIKENPQANARMTERALFELMNRAISLSATIARQASELNALAEAFPADQQDLLSTADQGRILALVKDHLGLLSSATTDLGNLLDRLIADRLMPPTTTRTGPSPATWQTDALEERTRSRAIADKAIDLFTSHPSHGAPSGAEQIGRELSQLDADLVSDRLFAGEVELRLDREIARCAGGPSTPLAGR